MESSGVTVCLNVTVGEVPSCPHGPTLLFQRNNVNKDRESRKFYACSACRNRQDCSFFQWVDDKVTPARIKARQQINAASCPPFTHKQYYDRLQKFNKLVGSDRTLCADCDLLLLPEDWVEHAKHSLKNTTSPSDLHRPSKLLKPLDNNKSNAQFLFSKTSTNFLIESLQNLKFTKVLCIGAPRIHEDIVQKSKEKKNFPLSSLLLDIDHRFEQFYSVNEFVRYNLFNHYFFGNAGGEKVFRNFVSKDAEKLILVMDPPFGGYVEVMAHTIRRISALWKENHYKDDEAKELPIMLIFPYFMEPKVAEHMPSLKMSDYKIEYDNHPFYQGGTKGRKHGSPVRMFTNIDSPSLVLPVEEGYKYCDICERYVYNENQHCQICNACTSKDGRPYKHCGECKRCVKSSKSHCDTCGVCCLPDHQCGDRSLDCFNCGQPGHKKRDCPNAALAPTKGKKRKGDRQKAEKVVRNPRNAYLKKKKVK